MKLKPLPTITRTVTLPNKDKVLAILADVKPHAFACDAETANVLRVYVYQHKLGSLRLRQINVEGQTLGYTFTLVSAK